MSKPLTQLNLRHVAYGAMVLEGLYGGVSEERVFQTLDCTVHRTVEPRMVLDSVDFCASGRN